MREQMVDYITADHTDRAGVFFFEGRNITSVLNIDRTDFGHISRDPTDAGIFARLISKFHGGRRLHLNADTHTVSALISDGLGILQGEILVLLSLNKFLEISNYQRCFGDLEDIGP